ncbi:unnamed protein product [Candidula unifasciata]|uniref:BolA-like protein 3 n=1 Tax=Candidula unifasciata TaxID=100452 RepID=A0A8S3Z5X3_9EUPU|nr:unnamed protein product [Candidula unifasciata]
MHGVISRFVGQFRCALRIPVIYTLRLHPLSTGVGEGEALGSDLTVGEQKIIAKLRESFPDASDIQVSDISGGCGAMYQISIEAPAFTGLKTVQQHRLVNEALANEIKSMHGLQLNTKAPDKKKK